MKWALPCIKLIYQANNSPQNKRHPMDAFFIIASQSLAIKTIRYAYGAK